MMNTRTGLDPRALDRSSELHGILQTLQEPSYDDDDIFSPTENDLPTNQEPLIEFIKDDSTPVFNETSKTELQQDNELKRHVYLIGDNNTFKLRLIISELYMEIEKGKGKLEDVEMKNMEFEKKIIDLEAEKSVLRNQNGLLEGLKELRGIEDGELERLRGVKLNKVIEENKRLQRDYNVLYKEKERIENEVKQSMRNKDLSIRSAEDEIRRLNFEINETNTILEARGNNIEELNKEIQILKENEHKILSEKEKEIEKKDNQIIDEKRELLKMKDLQNKNLVLRNEMENFKRENAIYNRKFIKQKNELKSKMLIINNLQQKLSHVSPINEKYESEIEILKQEILSQKIISQKTLLNVETQTDDESMSHKNDVIKNLKKQIKILLVERETNEELNRKKIDLLKNDQKNHIKNICEKMIRDKKSVMNETRQLQSELEKQKKQNIILQGEVVVERNKSTSIHKSLLEIKEKNNYLQKKHSSGSWIDEKMKNDLIEEKKKNSEHMNSISDLKRKVLILSENLKRKTDENLSYINKINRVNTKDELLSSSLNKNYEKVKKELKRILVQRKNEMIKVNEKFSKMKDYIQKQKHKVETKKAKIEILQIELNRIKKTIDLKDKQINHLSKQVKLLSEN